MNSKQRRKRDRSRAGYSKHWALVDRKSARDVLRYAREAGVPWREYSAEIARIKQQIFDDIERNLAKLYPLTLPRDAPRIEQVVGDVLRRAEFAGDLSPETITIESVLVV